MRRIDVFSRSEYPVHLGHGLRHVVDMLEHGRRKEDFAFASLSLWFLLLMALAGPPKEKPHLSPSHNAGTAEPMGVSLPEAMAYQVLVKPM